MKNIILFLIALSFNLPTALATWTLPPADYNYTAPEGLCPREGGKPLIYKVCADQMALFTEAVEKAKTENKLLMVKVGATWCPWCHSLHKMVP